MKGGRAWGRGLTWVALPAACALLAAFALSPGPRPRAQPSKAPSPVEPARPAVLAQGPGVAPSPRSVQLRDDSLLVMEIRGLVREQKLGAARARARSFYESEPESPLTAEVERLTGAHPHP